MRSSALVAAAVCALSVIGCASLSLRPDDSGGVTAAKAGTRVVLGLATLGISEIAIALSPAEANDVPDAPDLRAAPWVNPSSMLTGPARDKELARVKASCIERAYVGQGTTGRSSGRIFGGGSVNRTGSSYIGGSEESTFDSQPVFDDQLFEACMGIDGWVLKEGRPIPRVR
jgi:hypothetical protein